MPSVHRESMDEEERMVSYGHSFGWPVVQERLVH